MFLQRKRHTVFTTLTLSILMSVAAVAIGAVSKAAPPDSKKKNASKNDPQMRQSQDTVAHSSLVVYDNTPLTEEQKIVHVLNRMGFGPRPGDVEKVKAQGLNHYVELQLMPEKIPDTAVTDKIATLNLLQQTPTQLAELYYSGLKKTVKTLQARQTMAQTAGINPDATMAEVQKAVTEPGKAKKLKEAMSALTPKEQEDIREYRDLRARMRDGNIQMAAEKVTRAVESERQFQEVMTDFWSNHFNIDIRKNACAVYKIVDERDVIRPNLFGKFRDLLGASAKSPAMLIYLDNAQSSVERAVNPRTDARRQAIVNRLRALGMSNSERTQTPTKNRAQGGINENYARELMELHTMGVDGGYSQKDVQELARCLTGWTIDRQTGLFLFAKTRHDNGEKRFLGRVIPAGGGMSDGEKALDILSNQPATMRFISTKLCRRLVSDTPPPSLVDKCVATWKRTQGDLHEVYRTIVMSPEFYSRLAYRQKIKTPFEYAVSSIRALGGSIDLSSLTSNTILGVKPNRGKSLNGNLGRTTTGQITTLGQPLYQCQPPTGWTEDSKQWVSTGALVARLNYSLALADGKITDVILPPLPSTSNSEAEVNALAKQLLSDELTPSTRATLLKEANATPENTHIGQKRDTVSRLTALVLGSPEFQRR